MATNPNSSPWPAASQILRVHPRLAISMPAGIYRTRIAASSSTFQWFFIFWSLGSRRAISAKCPRSRPRPTTIYPSLPGTCRRHRRTGERVRDPVDLRPSATGSARTTWPFCRWTFGRQTLCMSVPFGAFRRRRVRRRLSGGALEPFTLRGRETVVFLKLTVSALNRALQERGLPSGPLADVPALHRGAKALQPCRPPVASAIS